MHRFSRVLTVAILLTLSAVPAKAEEPSDDIRPLIAALDAPDKEERDAAKTALKNKGEDALVQLESVDEGSERFLEAVADVRAFLEKVRDVSRFLMNRTRAVVLVELTTDPNHYGKGCWTGRARITRIEKTLYRAPDSDVPLEIDFPNGCLEPGRRLLIIEQWMDDDGKVTCAVAQSFTPGQDNLLLLEVAVRDFKRSYYPVIAVRSGTGLHSASFILIHEFGVVGRQVSTENLKSKSGPSYASTTGGESFWMVDGHIRRARRHQDAMGVAPAMIATLVDQGRNEQVALSSEDALKIVLSIREKFGREPESKPVMDAFLKHLGRTDIIEKWIEQDTKALNADLTRKLGVVSESLEKKRFKKAGEFLGYARQMINDWRFSSFPYAKLDPAWMEKIGNLARDLKAAKKAK